MLSNYFFVYSNKKSKVFFAVRKIQLSIVKSSMLIEISMRRAIREKLGQAKNSSEVTRNIFTLPLNIETAGVQIDGMGCHCDLLFFDHL